MVKTLEISIKFFQFLEEIAPQVYQEFGAELLSIAPASDAEIQLKIGNGEFPESNERTMSLFIQITKLTENPTTNLETVLQSIVQASKPDEFAILMETFEAFKKEATAPFDVRFMPAVRLEENIACIHISLAGKLA